jgi:Predicted membrane protein
MAKVFMSNKAGRFQSVKNIFLILLATNIVALGVALLLKAGMGTDPLTVLQDGLHVKLHITVGEAALLYNVSVLFMAFLLAREKLGLGSAIFSLSFGPFIDMHFNTVALIPLHGIPCLILGLIIMCFGSSFVISLNFGMSGLDALLLTLQDEKGVRYAILRTISDALCTIAGWFMGGTVGWGTLLVILLSGFLIDNFRKIPPFKKYISQESIL